MSNDDLWNLLDLSTTSLTISVSILLWFLTDYLNRLDKAETESSSSDQEMLASSTRVAVIILGVIAVLAFGLLTGSVTVSNLNTLQLSFWTQEFLLLSISILLPIVAAAVAGLLIIEKVRLSYIFKSFEKLLSMFRSSTLDLASVITEVTPLEQLSHKSISPSPRVIQEWEAALKWAKAHERQWRLGKKFIEINRVTLIRLVGTEWDKIQSQNDKEEVPRFVALRLGQALRILGADYAVTRNKHDILAKAACALYEAEMKG